MDLKKKINKNRTNACLYRISLNINKRKKNVFALGAISSFSI